MECPSQRKGRHMNYTMYIVAHLVPVLLADAEDHVNSKGLEQKMDAPFEKAQKFINELAQQFVGQNVTPERTFAFAHELQEALRELGRQVAQTVFNQIEGEVESLPKHVHFEASQ